MVTIISKMQKHIFINNINLRILYIQMPNSRVWLLSFFVLLDYNSKNMKNLPYWQYDYDKQTGKV